MRLVNADIYKLLELVNRRKIVCFGAGQALTNFLNMYSTLELEDKINCIVDNSEEKIGTYFFYNNKKIPIISVDCLKKMKDVVVIITSRHTTEMFQQISEYEELRESLCFVSYYIMSETNMLIEEKRKYPANFRITKEPCIPKIIHYCWFGGNEMPAKNCEWIKSWKKYCPDYQIIEWNESNYDITKNKYMYEAYKNKKWGFVSDYARMDLVYEYGGIYLDTDVEIIKNLDDLLYQPAFAGIESTKLINLGLGFGAQKNNPIIKLLREDYEDKSFIKEDGKLDLTPIPKVQKKLFNSFGYINNGEYQVLSDITIYPEKVLSGKCNWTGRVLPIDKTYAIHHYDGSWVDENIKMEDIMRKELFVNASKL